MSSDTSAESTVTLAELELAEDALHERLRELAAARSGRVAREVEAKDAQARLASAQQDEARAVQQAQAAGDEVKTLIDRLLAPESL